MMQEIGADMVDKRAIVWEQMPQHPRGGHADSERHGDFYHQLALRADLFPRPP
ncbi:hypothetical protein D3C78_1723070 [compost metagenome]